MKEAERLAERLETEAAAWEHHGNQSEWRETLRSAASLIRSQAEELERLRGALLHIVAIANTRDIEDTEAGFKPRKSAVHVPYKLVNRARAALGER